MTTKIEDALAALNQGRFVIVADDFDRENEGDLIMATEKVTPEAIAFMVRHTSGIICISMLEKRLESLKIPQMVKKNTEAKRCAFTVSVDYRFGTTTGVSAADRAKTIQALIHKDANPEDFNRPGHVFPLRYQEGGVLKRAGHTEAAVDLAKLAGLYPSGILCELVNDDGTMMRMPELKEFSKKHDLLLISVQEIIQHLRTTENVLTSKNI